MADNRRQTAVRGGGQNAAAAGRQPMGDQAAGDSGAAGQPGHALHHRPEENDALGAQAPLAAPQNDAPEAEEAAREDARSWAVAEEVLPAEVLLQTALELAGEDELSVEDGGDGFAVIERLVELQQGDAPPPPRTTWNVETSYDAVEVAVDKTPQNLSARVRDMTGDLQDRFLPDLDDLPSTDDALCLLADHFLGSESELFRLLRGGGGFEDDASLNRFLATFCYLSGTCSSAKEAYDDPRRRIDDLTSLEDWTMAWQKLGAAVVDGLNRARPLALHEERSTRKHAPLWAKWEDALNRALQAVHTTKMTVSFDDDKVHFSQQGQHWAADLLVQFHAKARRLGFVAHVAVCALTGVPLAVCFQRYGMNVDSCMMQVVRSVGSSGGAVAKQHLDSIWACDRAYEFPPAVKEIVSTGGMVMGTSRRTLGKPMTHGQDRQNDRDHREHVSESGARCLIVAKAKDEHQRTESIWRNGNNGAAMLSHAAAPGHPLAVRPLQLELADVRQPRRESRDADSSDDRDDDRDANLDRSFAAEPTSDDANPVLLSKDVLLLLKLLDIVPMTGAGVQGGSIWKALRGAAVTSSSAYEIVSILEREFDQLPDRVRDDVRGVLDIVARQSQHSDAAADPAEPASAANPVPERLDDDGGDDDGDGGDGDSGDSGGDDRDGGDRDGDVDGISGVVAVDNGSSESGDDSTDVDFLAPDAHGQIAAPEVTLDEEAEHLLLEDVTIALSDEKLASFSHDLVASLCLCATGVRDPTRTGKMSTHANHLKELKEWRDTEPDERPFRLLTCAQLKKAIEEQPGYVPRRRGARGGKALPTRKEDLVKLLAALRRGEVISGGEAHKTLFDAIIRRWVLPGAEGKAKKEMLTGRDTEAALARALLSGDKHNPVAGRDARDIVCHIVRLGLVHRTNKMYLKGSIDRLAVVGEDAPRIAAVEIKTRTVASTIAKEEDARHAVCQELGDSFERRAFFIDLEANRGVELFQLALYKRSERIQVLHHCAVLNRRECLFAVGRPGGHREGELLVVYWIKFSQETLDSYTAMIDHVYERCLKWFYDGDEIPPEMHAAARRYAYTSDGRSFDFGVNLLRELHKQEFPLPDAKFLLPSIVVLWNKLKGGTDKLTQLCNQHTTQLAPSIVSPQSVVIQRLLLYTFETIHRLAQVLTTRRTETLEGTRWNSNKRVSAAQSLLKLDLILMARVKGDDEPATPSPPPRPKRGAELQMFRSSDPGTCGGGIFTSMFRKTGQKSRKALTCATCHRRGKGTYYCFGCKRAFCTPTKPRKFPDDASAGQLHLEWVQVSIDNTDAFIPNSCYVEGHKHLRVPDPNPAPSKSRKTE
jgi:hypothetical protein